MILKEREVCQKEKAGLVLMVQTEKKVKNVEGSNNLSFFLCVSI